MRFSLVCGITKPKLRKIVRKCKLARILPHGSGRGAAEVRKRGGLRRWVAACGVSARSVSEVAGLRVRRLRPARLVRAANRLRKTILRSATESARLAANPSAGAPQARAAFKRAANRSRRTPDRKNWPQPAERHSYGSSSKCHNLIRPRAAAARAVFSFLLAFLIAGCASPRKLASKTKEKTNVEEKRTETTAGEIFHRVDTTKTEDVENTYTKIEFFPPEPDKQETKPDTTATGGPSNPVADTPKNTTKEPKEKRPPDTGKRGAIKSIESYTMKQKSEAAGVTQTEQKEEATKTEEVNTDSDTEIDVTEEPAADPYRWRYIFGILLLLAVAFFFLRKAKVFRAVAAFFRKLF